MLKHYMPTVYGIIAAALIIAFATYVVKSSQDFMDQVQCASETTDSSACL